MNNSATVSNARIIPLLIFGGIAHFFVDSMLGIWSIYKSIIHLDIATAGIIVAVGAFIGEGSQLFFGTLSDKGYRKLLIIFGLIMTMASAFFVYMSNYLMLFFLYLATCLGSGSFHPCAASLMSGLIPKKRGLILTIFAAGGSLGLATSQLIFKHTYEFFDGHTYMLALPAFGIVSILAYLSFPEHISTTPMQPKFIFRDFFSFFKNPSLRSLYISQVANQSILWGMIFILPDTLQALGHTDWICYGGGHFCFIIGAACMVIPGGYLADMYTARPVMLYGSFLSTFIFYFILYSEGLSPLLVMSALFLLGASLSLMSPLAIALGTQLEPLKTGAVSAFLMGLVWCASEALGPGGVGILTRLFDDYAPVKALAILGSLFLVQIYGILKLPKEVVEETKRKNAEIQSLGNFQ